MLEDRWPLRLILLEDEEYRQSAGIVSALEAGAGARLWAEPLEAGLAPPLLRWATIDAIEGRHELTPDQICILRAEALAAYATASNDAAAVLRAESFARRLSRSPAAECQSRALALLRPIESARAGLDDLLGEIRARGAHDLLLCSGTPPRARAFHDEEQLGTQATDLGAIASAIFDEAALERLGRGLLAGAGNEQGSARTAYVSPAHGRFRVEARLVPGRLEIAFHAVASTLPAPEALGLDAKLLARMTGPRPGLVVIGGPRGSGRSTVQALLVEMVSAETAAHVLTIEDPIEFVHPCRRFLVTQREVGRDVPSIEAAAEAALRDLPEVVCVGPLERDTVIETALRLADAGALVIGTTEAATVVEARKRLLAPFPLERRPQVQARIGRWLSAIHCQLPVRLSGSRGFAPAVEALQGTPVTRRLFARESDEGLRVGMCTAYAALTRNQSLLTLVRQGALSADDALAQTQEADELRAMLRMMSARERRRG